jgi:dipeptidyl aminopeptidase/acylaminoacyl peptidase
MIYLHYRQNGIWPEEVSGFDRATIAENIVPFEPVRNVTADFPPTLVIHGTNDTDVPFEQSTLMVEQFKQHGVPFIFKPIENGEHGLGGGDPRQIEDAWKTLREFVVKHLTSSE